MSLNRLRTAGSIISLAGILSAFSLAFSGEAQAVTHNDVKKIVSAPGTPSDADVKTMDDYLKKDFFGKFLKPESGDTLPLLRKDLRQCVNGVPKTPAHDRFNSLVLQYAGKVLPAKVFPPAAKYNTILLIGDLNESEEVGKIKPYAPALDFLMKVLSIPPTTELAYLKPAALVGITRFAEEKVIPADKLATVSKELLKLLNETDAPAGRSASAQNFMRRSAGKALATIGSPGANNIVLKSFEAIAADPQAKFTLRCEMAQYIGMLNTTPESKVDTKAAANIIGRMIVEVCQQELDRAIDEKRDPSRRVLMYALYSGGAGLGSVGVSGIGRSVEKGSEAAKFIKDIRDPVTALYKLLDDPEKKDAEIADPVMQTLTTLSGLLVDKPAPAAPLVAGSATAKP